MRPSLLIASILLGVHSLAAVRAAGLTNLDFEIGQAGETPLGWSVPPMLKIQGFAAVLTTNEPYSGKLCVEIRWPTNEVAAGQFANLMQSVDASPWRNKRIKVTAAVRVRSSGDEQRAQMWLRVDRIGAMGAFDNMGDRPIRSPSWADYSIIAEVAEDAQRLNLGLMTMAGATAWWDAVRIETVGEFASPQDPPRPLDDIGLRNLTAFARLLGYVRYYHPSDRAATNDWLRFAVQVIPQVETARNPDELAGTLQAAFGRMAPTVRVFENGKPPALAPELGAPTAKTDLKVRVWEHEGCGPEKPVGWVIYRSTRRQLDPRDGALPAYAQPTNVFSADLGRGLTCRVPTALWADERGTLPHAGLAEDPRAEEVRFTGSHRGARLATVMLAWNIFRHFYPYFDVIETDWSKELELGLRAASTNVSEGDFYRTLNRLVVQLHDGHANLTGPGMPAPARLRARIELIEGCVVVTGVPPGFSDLKPGDIVDRIEGRPARDVFDEIAAGISAATPQWRTHKAAQAFGPRPPAATAALEMRSADSSSRTVKVACSGGQVEDALRTGLTVRQITPGVFYLDITRLTDDEFKSVLPDLAIAKGLVFDMRGYPSMSPGWLSHLSPNRLESARWNVPKTHRPENTDVEWVTSGRWNLQPAQPQLTTNRVFLTYGGAISYAESVMGIVEAYHLGAIVGEPTAGTNGNVNRSELPLGYSIVWTGMKVLKHDGTRHHGVGISPTHPVGKTIRGIREGRDEQLEAALRLLSK